MEGRYPQGIWITLCDCTDLKQENKFNHWYNEILIPDMEALEFVRNTRRYENVLSKEPTFLGRPKYLAFSEVYRDDQEQALNEIRQFFNGLKAKGKGFDAMVAKVDTLYRRIGPELRSERTGRPVKGLLMAFTYCTDSAREEELNKWYDKVHFPETVAYGRHDTGYRYKVVDPHDPMPRQTVPYFAFYETSMDPLAAADEMGGFRDHSMKDPMFTDLLATQFAGSFRQIYPQVK